MYIYQHTTCSQPCAPHTSFSEKKWHHHSDPPELLFSSTAALQLQPVRSWRNHTKPPAITRIKLLNSLRIKLSPTAQAAYVNAGHSPRCSEWRLQTASYPACWHCLWRVLGSCFLCKKPTQKLGGPGARQTFAHEPIQEQVNAECCPATAALEMCLHRLVMLTLISELVPTVDGCKMVQQYHLQGRGELAVGACWPGAP